MLCCLKQAPFVPFILPERILSLLNMDIKLLPTISFVTSLLYKKNCVEDQNLEGIPFRSSSYTLRRNQ